MQYHYVVMYDTNTGKWTIENEAPYLTDGNVWDDDIGWFVPTEEPFRTIDERCAVMVSTLASSWPAVDASV